MKKFLLCFLILHVSLTLPLEEQKGFHNDRCEQETQMIFSRCSQTHSHFHSVKQCTFSTLLGQECWNCLDQSENEKELFQCTKFCLFPNF